jgi:hypothetical protein
MKKFTLENKPTFDDGDIVKIDMNGFGLPPEIRSGKIVGKGMTNIIDIWYIEFENMFGPTYPYKVVGIPHTLILDETENLNEYNPGRFQFNKLD